MQSIPRNLQVCVRFTFSGGSGALGISDWFLVKPDGTIVSYSFTGGVGLCAIFPGNPPELEIFDGQFQFFPYSDDLGVSEFPAVPEGFKAAISISTIHGNIFWLDGRRDDHQFYINSTTNTAGFITQYRVLFLISCFAVVGRLVVVTVACHQS